MKYIPLFGIFCFAVFLVLNSLFAGLGHIPGPFLAKFTQLHGFLATWKAGRNGDYLVALHQRYGDVVRIGPRTVSVANPEAIAVIYNTKARLQKVCVALRHHGGFGARAARLTNLSLLQFESVSQLVRPQTTLPLSGILLFTAVTVAQ